MKRVAFICVHNSCRSQIAEALGKHLASDVFECDSAGTVLKERINPGAGRLMKELNGIGMEVSQRTKQISQIPRPDMLIAMSDARFPVVRLMETGILTSPQGRQTMHFKSSFNKLNRTSST